MLLADERLLEHFGRRNVFPFLCRNVFFLFVFRSPLAGLAVRGFSLASAAPLAGESYGRRRSLVQPERHEHTRKAINRRQYHLRVTHC